jgi:hypothetical protein
MSVRPGTDRRCVADRPARRSPVARAGGEGTGIAARVKVLQRSAGNRAVAQMLAPISGRLLQRRRLPPSDHLERLLFHDVGGVRTDAPDAAAHRAGIERLIGLAEQEMTAAQRAKVTALSHHGTTAASWAALSVSERDLREADAVMHVRPDLITHDPAHVVIGSRPGTHDAANLASVVAWANVIFARIATGVVDAHIAQVFGAANVAAAKAKYANGRTRMNQLFAMVPPKIMTDRSGYNAEAGVGGVTSDDQILVQSSVFDDPGSRDSVVTLIHEALHAGNFGDVEDGGGYIYRADEFLTAQPETKLTNAAHFEVVPRRMLGMGAKRFAYPGQTFHPAALPPPPGPGPAPPPPVGAAPARTPRQEAIHNVSEAFRISWALTDDLHRDVLTRLLQTPGDWNTADLHPRFGAGAAPHFSDTVPFLSKVLGMTIHKRASIDPASADPAKQPVTSVDVAISEAVVRKFSQLKDAVPDTEDDAVALENAQASPAERAAATTVAAETELLVKLVLRANGSVTTSPERDVHVVQTITADGESEEKLLKARAPAACTF